MVEVKEKLYEEFETEISNLRGMELGSKEYQACVDGITKIVDRIIAIEDKDRAYALNYDKNEREAEEIRRKAEAEESKRKAEAEEIRRKAEAEFEINNKKMRDERIDRWIGHGLTALKIGVSFGVPVWMAVVSMGFEHGETMTYSAGRAAIKDCLSFTKKG